MNTKLVLSFLYQKNSISEIRVKNPLRALDDATQDIYYFDIPYLPPAQKVLDTTAAIVVRGMCNPNALVQLSEIKKNPANRNIRFVLDNDDLVWTPLPEWNRLRDSYMKHLENSSRWEKPWLEAMDFRTFSTQFLADWVKTNICDKPSMVIPNTVRIPEWFTEHRPRTKDLKKPVVVYSASSTHYHNEKRLSGDWNSEWIAWIVEAVKAGKIELHVMGGLPFFFEEIKDRIKQYGWVSYSGYPSLIRRISPDFSINPLAPCDFNRAKSDIKMVEAAAMDCVCVGSVFDKSPYANCQIGIPEDMDRAGIEKAVSNACKKDVFEDMLAKQREWMNVEGRWTESALNISRLKLAVTGKIG